MDTSGPDLTPTPLPQAPADPALEGLRAKANADEMKAVRVQASGDTASIMARYGTRLALAGSANVAAPAPAAPAAPAADPMQVLAAVASRGFGNFSGG